MNIDKKEKIRLEAEQVIKEVTIHHPDVTTYGAMWDDENREKIKMYVNFIRYNLDSPDSEKLSTELESSEIVVVDDLLEDKIGRWRTLVSTGTHIMEMYEDGYIIGTIKPKKI